MAVKEHHRDEDNTRVQAICHVDFGWHIRFECMHDFIDSKDRYQKYIIRLIYLLSKLK